MMEFLLQWTIKASKMLLSYSQPNFNIWLRILLSQVRKPLNLVQDNYGDQDNHQKICF